MQSQNDSLRTRSAERQAKTGTQAGTQAGTPTEALTEEQATEFPVREYIAAMAQELAQMARWDGDEALAVMLEAAVSRAATTLERAPVTREAAPSRARPS